MVRCDWEVNLGRICLSMKRARGKKPEEINLAPASSSAAQNGKHQKRFILCSPAISLKTVQLEVILSDFVFLCFSLFFKQLNFPEGFQAAQQNKNNLKDVSKDYSSRQLSTFQMTSGSFSWLIGSKRRDRLLDNFLRVIWLNFFIA